MGKIYDLYPKRQRKIDNQARRIRGYEKMKKDLTNANRKLNHENRELLKRINKAIEYIKHSWWLRTDQVYDTSKDLKGWEVEELLSILERGKE